MLKQRTINNIVSAVGVGLHSGKRVAITFRPAKDNTGVVFRRIDLASPVDIHVSVSTVSETNMATTVSKDGVKVQTIEHLMSALSGLGIDNIYIDIDADEVPILDGSAASFIFLLQSAGINYQLSAKKFVKVIKEVYVEDGIGTQRKWAKLTPFNGFKLNFKIDFNHPAVKLTGQETKFDFSVNNYIKEVSRARTFGFTKDVEYLRKRGLAMGGGLDNAIVLDDYKILNPTGLRYEDEFSRHKLLDAIGDLYCIGHLFLAEYTAYKSGHFLNNQLLRKLISENAFEIVTFADEEVAPINFSQLNTAFS